MNLKGKVDEFNALYEHKKELTQLVNSGHINLQNRLVIVNRRLARLRAEIAEIQSMTA